MVYHGISQPSPSTYSARSNLDSTVNCDVTERDSPTLFQTSHGEWVKRERLGTRLRISDTRTDHFEVACKTRSVFWRIAPWGCFWGVLSLFRVACGTWNRQKDCMTKGHFRVPRTLTFKLGPSAQPFLWKWVLFEWEWKIISILKAEHLTSFGYRGPENSEMACYRSTIEDRVDYIIFDWKVVKIHEIVPDNYKKSLFPFFLSWWMK